MGSPRVGAFIEEPVPSGDRVVERGRKRVLRGEPISDRREPRAGRRREPPGDVAVELRRSGDVTAAMQEQDVAIRA